MTSARRVAFSLFGVAAACGVVLLFTMTSANGQNSAAPSGPSGNSAFGNSASGNSATAGASAAGAGMGSPAPTGTPMPSFRRVVGVPPVRRPNTALVNIGLGASASVDLEGQYIYSLLSQPGSGDYPLVLDSRSAARPSFIIEKLIVQYQGGGDGGATSGTGTTGQTSPSSRGASGPGGATPGSQGGTTVSTSGVDSYKELLEQVRTYITAELTRGSGRARGAHRTKLLFLNSAVGSLLDMYNDDRTQAIQALLQQGNSKFDVTDYLFAEARQKARQGDDYVPVTF